MSNLDPKAPQAPSEAETLPQAFSADESFLLSMAVPTHKAPPGLRDRILGRIAANPYQPMMVESREAEAVWQPLPFPGMTMRTLFTDAKTGRISVLLRMEPGSQIPRHLHHDEEQCLILEGAVQIAGQNFGKGDFMVAASGTNHQPIQSASGALLLLITGDNDYS